MVSLQSNRLFSGLDAAELEQLRAAAREDSFKPNHVIFKEGDAGDGVYFVRSGVVRISATAGYGESKILTQIKAGEFFGEMAVLDNQPRSATATAEEAVVAYFINRHDMDALLNRAPGLAMAMSREIIRRFRLFNREVLESERMALVGRFASSIVHDLKNPLNIISLSADMVTMPNATPQSVDAATERIRNQVDRISNMVNELLEFTQGSSGAAVLAPMDYQKFVERLVDEIRPELAIKSVQIEYTNPPPPVKMLLDPRRLSRVFLNFAGNAADAMPGGGVLRLNFIQSDNELTTELRDSGKGIAPEMQARLFQAFATHGKVKGTGLGLSICKKIVLDHGGRIFGRNAPGGGAVFGFTLPIPAT